MVQWLGLLLPPVVPKPVYRVDPKKGCQSHIGEASPPIRLSTPARLVLQSLISLPDS